MTRWWLVPALALACACSEERARPSKRPERPPPPVAAVQHKLRVVSSQGKSTPKLQADAVYDELVVELAADARATFAIDDDVRIDAQGPATLSLLPAGVPSVLASSGLLAVDVAATGVRAGKAFWVATPAARVDVPSAGRFVVEGAELAVVSGQVALSGHDGTTPLGPGRFCLGDEVRPAGSDAAATLEAAREALAGVGSCALASSLEALDAQLTREAGLVERDQALEQALLTQHIAAVQGRDVELASELRGQLVERTMALMKDRERVRAVSSRLRAVELDPGHHDARRQALLERVQSLENAAP